MKASGGVLGWDIETTPKKDFFFRRCRTIQFGNLNEQYVIDLLAFAQLDTPPHGLPASDTLYDAQGYYGKNLTPSLRHVLDTIAPVLCSKDFLKVGVNLSFEYQMFYWLFGMRTFNFYDCTMAEKCIWAGAHSLKDYSFYSMNEMVERYFKQTVDKQYQESFNLEDPLSQGQIDYGALDTRLPLGVKTLQGIIASGKRLRQIRATQPNLVKYFEHLQPQIKGSGEPIIMGDKLDEIIQIENDAIGAFEDMHIHGENLDKDKWLARVDKKKLELTALYKDILDPFFIPFVGSKLTANTDAEIEAAELKWKGYNIVSDEELKLKADIRAAAKNKDLHEMHLLETEKLKLETKRKENKEFFKTAASEMKKKRTRIKNLAAKCDGEALINYSADKQLLAVLQSVKGLKNLTSMDDEILEKYEEKGFLICGAIRKLHELCKAVGTYGDAWAQKWATKPCKEEGWLHPGDGRLHCVFNQYDAETGRSSSEKPNGQNLPQDKEVRSCFVADPPNEAIRISDCCESDTTKHNEFVSCAAFTCDKCGEPCKTHAEEYVVITADMSGAELRIIAELAKDEVWCGAFNRGEDVHSVGTELLQGAIWVNNALPTCAYYKLKDNGEPAHQKCKCPMHEQLRNDNKSTNFLLAYGGGPHTLAKRIKQALEYAQDLMAKHEKAFPKIWAYLKKSGTDAGTLGRSFDMFGRRRLFPEPTWERAKQLFKDDNEKKLRIDEDEAQLKVDLFKQTTGRDPDETELWNLTHRPPTDKEISKTLGGMKGSIERQGKNHAIQGTNASIIKLAMGCGFDANGKPYLWHTLPQYRAKLIKMVHDELVVSCPKQYANTVAALIGDAFKRAAATKMRLVEMEFSFEIDSYWKK